MHLRRPRARLFVLSLANFCQRSVGETFSSWSFICVVEFNISAILRELRRFPGNFTACEIIRFFLRQRLAKGNLWPSCLRCMAWSMGYRTVRLHGHHLYLSIMSAASERPISRWSLVVTPILDGHLGNLTPSLGPRGLWIDVWSLSLGPRSLSRPICCSPKTWPSNHLFHFSP